MWGIKKLHIYFSHLTKKHICFLSPPPKKSKYDIQNTTRLSPLEQFRPSATGSQLHQRRWAALLSASVERWPLQRLGVGNNEPIFLVVWVWFCEYKQVDDIAALYYNMWVRGSKEKVRRNLGDLYGDLILPMNLLLDSRTLIFWVRCTHGFDGSCFPGSVNWPKLLTHINLLALPSVWKHWTWTSPLLSRCIIILVRCSWTLLSRKATPAFARSMLQSGYQST